MVTVLEASVEPDREADLLAAYRATADMPFPAAVMHSYLVRARDQRSTFRIMTTFRSMEDLVAMRASGETPRGVVIFNAAGADPVLSVYEVVDELEPPRV